MASGRIWKALCADDEPEIRHLVSNVLSDEGFKVVTAADGREALDLFAAESPDVVILDLKMPEFDGLEVLRQIKSARAETPVILVTGYGDVATAVEAMRRGAYDFIAKPFLIDDFVATVRRTIERQTLLGEVESLRRQAQEGAKLIDLMGSSDAMQAVVRKIQQVAPSSFTVVLCGETGTGKELAARAIHQQSERSRRPLVAIDCGAIPENLLESALFGHEKGAFTGADQRKEGFFQLAAGGTLFLDEVTNLPAVTQAKLLRALQEKTIQPLGATAPLMVDVRVIAATNLPLEGEVSAGHFREDLYYRLNEFTIALPPLRERRQDIPALARHFLAEAGMEIGRPIRTISEDALHTLLTYPWPGNVRQLRNVIRQAALVGPSIIRSEDLGLALPSEAKVGLHNDASPHGSLKAIGNAATMAAEGKAIRVALKRAQGNKSEAARILGTDYKTLHGKMKRYGITTGDALVEPMPSSR